MKIRPTTYTFDASAKTITCSAFTSLEAIQLITNVTDNIIIYNFADANKGGSLTGTTLTLAYDTSLMSDSDKLQIFLEDDPAPTYGNNASISAIESTVGTVTTTTIQKTIGSNVYEKTVTKDSSDGSTTITSWILL